MQQIEFTVDNAALATVKDIVINANFEEVEAWLKEMVSPYASMVVTEETIAGAKADRAKLRKVKASIDEYRKSIERDYKKPVEDFKKRVKPLLEICDSGIDNLDIQVKEFENAQKREKTNALRDYFDSNAGEAAEFIGFDYIFNPKWENNGFPFEDAQAEIDEAISRTTDSVMAIRSVGNEFVPSLLQEYSRCHDLAAVLRMNQQLIDRKAAEEKRKAQEERIRSAERASILRFADEPPQTIAFAQIVTENEEFVVDFRVYATRDQLSNLKAFLNANGIRYGRVPE